MAWAYFDTSALIKRYVRETGRREVLQLFRVNECVTSVILPVEIRGALRRRVSEATLDKQRVPEILNHLAADREFLTLVEVTSGVLTAAEALVAVHPIRTLDAIHVASAQVFANRVGVAELVFVSADVRQSAAAAAAGVATTYVAT